MTGVRAIIVFIGNDGTGKSSTVNKINLGFEQHGIIALERSQREFAIQHGVNIDPSFVDAHTLNYSFETQDIDLQPTFTVPNVTSVVPVYWILLDAPVETLEARLKSRKTTDVWETSKALFYYRKRFLEVSALQGVPVVDTLRNNLEMVVCICTKFVTDPTANSWYQEKRLFALKHINQSFIDYCDCENRIAAFYESNESMGGTSTNPVFQQLCKSDRLLGLFVEQYPQHVTEQFKARIIARYLSQGNVQIAESSVCFSRDLESIEYVYNDNRPILMCVKEGESKKIFRIVTSNPFLKGYALIVLKPTIYSHSNQSTGKIEHIDTIRAQGTKIFLEMMYRNGLDHTYVAIHNSFVLSNYVPVVPPVEIVVKRDFQGTDKYSYHGMGDIPAVVLPTSGQYTCGPYVRFDWRNPNHIERITRWALSDSPFYYLLEAALGKEQFLEQCLNGHGVPMGDKTVNQDLLHGVIDCSQARASVLKMFFTIQYYFGLAGLEIVDVCFMTDRAGTLFWSEINQDCMRIRSTEVGTSYDKDIWRAGGSSCVSQLLKKWVCFNDIMTKMFQAHRFHTGEIQRAEPVYLQEIRRMFQRVGSSDKSVALTIPRPLMSTYRRIIPKTRKRVIVTLDLYDGSPVLVRSGKVYTKHSGGCVQTAMDTLSVFPDILVVDLNGAFGDATQSNRSIVKQLASQYYVHTGGGLRTLDDVEDVLKSSARRVVISSASDEIISKIPKERLIVELSVNDKLEVLIHGRATNTGVKIIDRITQLAELGNVEAISLTFHSTEGHMQGIPRRLFESVYCKIPGCIEKIIIAGGVSTVDDLRYLWSFPRVIPQLGSAIWNNVLTVGDIYDEMVNYDEDGLVPAIVQDVHGRNKGLVYMNSEAVILTCDYRELYRFSREHNRLMKKGEQSGHTQYVHKVSCDCDSDTLLVTVDTEHPFCHTGNYSCFSLQTVVKANLSTLTEHIKSKMSGGSYSGVMQQNPGLPLAKLIEEFWEIVCATRDTQVSECSDLLVHLLMYMNGIGVTIETILNELNARRYDPRLTTTRKRPTGDSNNYVIAVAASKYCSKTDEFIEQQLGIRLIRGEGRSLQLDHLVVDIAKYTTYFGTTHTVSFIGARPKDMMSLLTVGRIDFAVTYETVVCNFPKVYTTIVEVVDPTIALALIARKNSQLDVGQWSESNKALIAAEHVWHVSEYFQRKGISPLNFHLDRITGSSESFLVNNGKYDLCDAVVESGKTLEENGLRIWDIIIPKGQVKIGLHKSLVTK